MRDGVYAFAPEEAKGYKFRFLSRFPISITLKASFTLPKKKDTWNAHVLEAGAQSLFNDMANIRSFTIRPSNVNDMALLNHRLWSQ